MRLIESVKPDGSIRTWGDLSYGGAYASSYNLALGKPATESSIAFVGGCVCGFILYLIPRII
jgi:hypothetical protein